MNRTLNRFVVDGWLRPNLDDLAVQACDNRKKLLLMPTEIASSSTPQLVIEDLVLKSNQRERRRGNLAVASAMTIYRQQEGEHAYTLIGAPWQKTAEIEIMMASLFDDSSDSEINRELESNDEEEDDDDDATTFTIATILRKRSGDTSRRDTITRTMPTISIHDISDKVDKCTQLCKTESLVMDDSSHHFRSGRESNISDITSMESVAGGLFSSTPYRDSHEDDKYANMPTIIRRNTANCMNHKVINERSATNMTEFNLSNRRSSIEKFMSVYEDLETQQITDTSSRTNDQSTSHVTTTARAVSVKSFVATTLKNVAEGFVARATSNTIADTCDGIGSWDVDEETSNYASKRTSLDIDTTIDYNNKDIRQKRNRRKSLNIRAEMTLLQDMVQSKTDECSRLKRVSVFLS